MEKKDILDILNIAELAEASGKHLLHDSMIAMANENLMSKTAGWDYGVDNGQVTDPWDRQAKPVNWIDAIKNATLQPATKAYVMEMLTSETGQNLLYFLNNSLSNMLKGKWEKKTRVPGMGGTYESAVGPATGTRTDEGYQSWMTPGDPATKMKNLQQEKAGYTQMAQQLIQGLGDEGLMRLMSGTP